MEHWEFLLQKEGDRSWLPLDSPDVEILEGRYRVVARSKYVNAAIDTRIAHLATEAMPPKRRVQKRTCRTNHDGLMVVIPFTHLEPGRWELCCSPSDLMTDLMAGAQPYALTLQVVAQSLEEDWDTDWASPSNALPDAALAPASKRTEPASNTSTQDTTLANPATIAGTLIPSPTGDPLSLPGSEPDRQPVSLPPEVAEILGASMDRLFQIAEQMSEQLVDEVLHDFDLTAIADAPTPTEAVEAGTSAPEVTPGTPSGSTSAVRQSDADDLSEQQHSLGYTLAVNETFVLTLDQATFVAAQGEVMRLSGQVAIARVPALPSTHQAVASTPPEEIGVSDPWESDVALNLPGATAQEIQLCLRDPQSLQVLVSDCQPLPHGSLPYSFTFLFSLPDALATHLVLGEVLLCGTLAEKAGTSIALVTQAFSITVDPSALVGELTKLHDALTTEIEDEERIDLPLELSSRLKEQATPDLDLSFLNWSVVEPPADRLPRFPSLAGQPLPPQLYRPDPTQAHSKALDLPAFKLASESKHATAEADLPASSDQPSGEPFLSETIAASVPDADLKPDTARTTASDPTPAVVPPSDDLPAAAQEARSSDAIVASNSTNSDHPDKAPLDLPSPTQMSFQSLKLQDRFLTRLTSLATDAELTALLKANIAPGQPPTRAAVTPSAADTRSLTEEIVVDDEPLPSGRRRSQPIAASESTVTSEATPLEAPPNPLILPADDPIPTPILELTTGELTAGKPVNIRVKLPNLLPRIYVKLWVTDRQTRSLLDGPRWLVDFLPNGLGDLEAMTPLTVPFGSVELRFEAIAVEMHTQRESYKVTVDRVVVPPDLPNVSLDDFHA